MPAAWTGRCSVGLPTTDAAVVAFISAEDEREVYQALARAVTGLEPGSYVLCTSLGADETTMRVATLEGIGRLLPAMLQAAGGDVTAREYSIPAEELDFHGTERLTLIEGGLQALSMGQLPHSVCVALETLLGLKAIWVMGLSWGGLRYGGISVGLRQDRALAEPEAVETLVHQASAAVRRLRAERELHAKSREMDGFFANSLDLLAIADSQGVMLRLAGAWEETLGYAPSDLEGHTFFEIIHPDDTESGKAALADLADQRALLEHVVRVRAADGGYRWVLWRLVPDGEIHYATGRDVTERRLVEEALRESEARYRLIAENTGDVIWLLDLETQRFVYVSPAFEQLRGYTPQEVMDAPMEASLTPESAALIAALLPGRIRAVAEGDPGALVQRHRVDQPCKDGRVVPTEVTTKLLVDEEGVVRRILGASRDITERIEAAEQLRRSEETMRAALDHLPGGAYIVDEEDRFVFMNQRLLLELRMDAEDVVGRSVEEIMPADDAAVFKEEARIVRETGRALHVERPGFAARRRRWVEATKYLLPAAADEVLLGGYSFDVSQRHDAQEALRSFSAELERKVLARTDQLEQAVSELEAFSYTVAHDLRSPLRAINGYATIMVEDHGEAIGDDGRDLCRHMIVNTVRMGELIDDLLAFSRLGDEALARERLDMSRLAEEAFHEQAEQSGSGASFSAGELPGAVGDPVMLKQVWVNLIGNALKFSAQAEQPTVEVGAAASAEELTYWVRDNGEGFDMAYAGKLFRVFERLQGAEVEGNGVGLAIVRRVVEKHGGRVWAEAAPGEGATFFFTLPLATDGGPKVHSVKLQ